MPSVRIALLVLVLVAAAVLPAAGATTRAAAPFRLYSPLVAADESFVPGRIPRPNPTLTPGDVLTTDVPTICTPGYSSTVRDVSEATKNYVYQLYGIIARVPGSYEIDHLISLELGGSNDVSNLWPESYDETNGARLKDTLENRLHDLVCAGQLDIEVAQQAIATDWYAAYQAYGK